MKFKASIDVMPLEALLDPQGKAVTQSMSNLGLNEISNVRIGKHITLFVEADNDKPTVIALREIAAGKVNKTIVDEIEQSQRHVEEQ